MLVGKIEDQNVIPLSITDNAGPRTCAGVVAFPIGGEVLGVPETSSHRQQHRHPGIARPSFIIAEVVPLADIRINTATERREGALEVVVGQGNILERAGGNKGRRNHTCELVIPQIEGREGGEIGDVGDGARETVGLQPEQGELVHGPDHVDSARELLRGLLVIEPEVSNAGSGEGGGERTGEAVVAEAEVLEAGEEA